MNIFFSFLLFSFSALFSAEQEEPPNYFQIAGLVDDRFKEKHWEFFKRHGQTAHIIDPLSTDPLSEPVEDKPFDYAYLRDGSIRTHGTVRAWGTTPSNREVHVIETPVTLEWDGTQRKHQRWEQVSKSIFQDYGPLKISLGFCTKGIILSRRVNEAPTTNILLKPKNRTFYTSVGKESHPGSIALHPTQPLCAASTDKDIIYLHSLDQEGNCIKKLNMEVSHTAQCTRNLGPDQIVFGHDYMATEVHGEVFLTHLISQQTNILSEPFEPFKQGSIVDTEQHCKDGRDTVVKFNPLKKQLLIQRAGITTLFAINGNSNPSLLRKRKTVQGCVDFTGTGDYLIVAQNNDTEQNTIFSIDTQNLETHRSITVHSLPLISLRCDSYSSTNSFAFCTKQDFYVVFNTEKDEKLFHRQGSDLSNIQWNPVKQAISILDKKRIKTWDFSQENFLTRYMQSITNKPQKSIERSLFHKLYNTTHKTDSQFYVPDYPAIEQLFERFSHKLPLAIKQNLETARIVEYESRPNQHIHAREIIEDDAFELPQNTIVSGHFERPPSYEIITESPTSEREESDQVPNQRRNRRKRLAALLSFMRCASLPVDE